VRLVTAGWLGIGRASALELSRKGLVVVLASRRAEGLQAIVRECEAAGGRARALALDLADAASISAACEQALKEFGRIDHLVNNAGVTEDGLLLRMKRADWDRVLLVNLTGALAMTR